MPLHRSASRSGDAPHLADAPGAHDVTTRFVSYFFEIVQVGSELTIAAIGVDSTANHNRSFSIAGIANVL